ncbi:RagB/SusD domain-containing protein [Flavobacterium sp. 90]|uniref:RagB/SusD family nutrient uptake outer membrane protein n=1 Tax=unclassified Flavobacterium TaxID=196869 RepID=UPI000EAC9667|nr:MULTISPECIES: RagB/SusD family nutrient uptake outer membrane protein [unclassified Flavobacterium]RKR05097.1 RagB/SusD domain-containing protein [Flavobacterium sp. 81]TCK56413.1 RagB/SusD domain-containing protein [Flavobacterium sp. 90]
MKSRINIYIAASLFSVFLGSCELTKDLDEYEPLYSLPAETAIADESSSELALTGVYAILQQKGGSNPISSILGSTLSGVDTGGYPAFLNAEDRALLANTPLTIGGKVQSLYAGEYTMINRANWVISGVEKLTDANFTNDNRRLEIIGEAKIMRALGHFTLLKEFGQFYDINSEYGVNVRLEPAKDATALPRVSVGATYDAILKDLEDGITLAPDLRRKYYANKTFAKGLKAKVLLYMGRYAEAAATAKDILDNSGPNFAMVSNFATLFDHSTLNTLNNTEGLFAVYADGDETLGNGNFWTVFNAVSDSYYNLGTTGTMTVAGQVINYDATRIPFMKTGSYAIPNFGYNGNMKFAQRFGPQSQFETVYYLRMAEIYLIYAEAAARSTNSVSSQALAALNAVRIRAGATTGGNGFVTYPAAISYAQFLEAVRIEKMMELGSETGENWYDLIRYDYADGFGTGFQVSNVKATATNPDFFIMPIPDVSIKAGNNIIKQNPGY